MKRLVAVAAIIFIASSVSVASKKQQNPPPSAQQSNPITIPTAPTQTIPSDVSFQLGRQSGKIDDMSSRLDNIEKDVKDISRDIGRLNVYASIASVILLAIIAPLIYEGVKRWIFK